MKQLLRRLVTHTHKQLVKSVIIDNFVVEIETVPEAMSIIIMESATCFMGVGEQKTET